MRPLIALFRTSRRNERDDVVDRTGRRTRALRRTRLFAVNNLGVKISGANLTENPQNS